MPERQKAKGKRQKGIEWRIFLFAVCLAPCALHSEAEPIRGFTAAAEVARAYDTVLDTAFDRLPEELQATCPPAPLVACTGLEALAVWWQIVLDPESRALDAAFALKADAAIAGARAFTQAEPERAEAWFYVGAAYGVRAQLRVLRDQRLAAARDGKVIKESLERALALDPSMDDAAFGVGMYRYYAAVAPAVLRMLRWLFLLPGGNRVEGLQQMERASQHGQLVRGEALNQIQIAYLWFEHRPEEAVQILRDLQSRYPHNLHWRQLEAEVLDVYLHDRRASIKASEDLLALALGRQVYRADIAEMRARLNLAAQWRALDQRDRSLEQLDIIIDRAPSSPADVLARARTMRRAITRR